MYIAQRYGVSNVLLIHISNEQIRVFENINKNGMMHTINSISGSGDSGGGNSRSTVVVVLFNSIQVCALRRYYIFIISYNFLILFKDCFTFRNR